MTRPVSPFTGFGLTPNSSIKFGIRRNPDGAVPDWEGGPAVVALPIANSNRTVRENLGRDPWVVTFRIELETLADLEALDAMQGQRATLWYLWAITSRAGGVHERIGSVDYLRLDGTRLAGIADRTRLPRGRAACTATFERDYVDPTPRTLGPYPPAPDPEL